MSRVICSKCHEPKMKLYISEDEKEIVAKCYKCNHIIMELKFQ